MRVCVVCFSSFLILTATSFAGDSGGLASVQRNIAPARLPVGFEPGLKPGQFISSGRGYRLTLTPGEAILNLSAPAGGPSRSETLRLRIAGANPRTDVAGADPLPGRSFYLKGQNHARWRTSVPQFRSVRYAEVYPGIDLVFYGNESRLEYDFVVSPGASLKQVQLEVSGAGRPRIASNGDLILPTAGGEVLLQKPVMYQEDSGKRRIVPGRFALNGNRIGFAAGPYDHSRALTVDPVLDYATYLGGAANERVNSVAVGSDGSTYVTGVSPAPDNSGQNEAFVAHISNDGKSLLFKTVLGGAGSSEARSMALDRTGNILVAGTTSAPDFPVLNALQPACAGAAGESCAGSAFLAKLNPDGSLNFATYFGGAGADEANAVAADTAGDIYIAGTTAPAGFPVFRALQSTSGGSKDGFLAKISGDGTQVKYATYLGGSGDDETLALAVGSDLSVYLTGRTMSTDFPVRQPFQQRCLLNPSGVCQGEAFLAKVSPDGASLVYSTYFGGSGGDVANAIAVDLQGRAYLAGVTSSSDFPLAAPLQSQPAGKSEAFVAQFLADGSTLGYSTYLGGSGDDLATSLTLDQDGYAFVSGRTGSPNFPIAHPVQAACFQAGDGACSQDAFVAVLNPAGSALAFSSYLGGEGADQGNGLAIDASGSVFLGGSTTSARFPSAKLIETGSARLLALDNATRSARRASVPAPTVGGGMLVKLSNIRPHLNATLTCPAGSLTWTGAAQDNLWATASNWSGSAVPAATDNVCISSTFAGSTIIVGSLGAPNQTIASLVSNASLNISAGPLTVTGSAQFANNLTLANGAALVLNGGSGSNVGGTMTLAGLLAGTDTLTVTGLLTWQNGGQMCTPSNCQAPAGAQGVTNANGGIAGSGGNSLFGRTLNNSGTATFANGGALTMSYGAIVNNQSGATWNLASDYFIANGGNGAASGFINAGLFQKTGGTSTATSVAIPFANLGSVQVNAPFLGFQIVAPGGGSFSVQAGDTLALSAGSGFTSTLSGPIAGAGTVQFGASGGTLNLTGAYNVTGGTGGVSNGISNFHGTTTATGSVSATGSATLNFTTPIATMPISSVLVNNPNGTLNFSTGNPVTVTTLALTNGTLTGTDTLTITGLLTWSGGAICTATDCQAPAGAQAVTNANGGIAGSGDLYLYGRTLNNAGTATFSPASGSSNFFFGYNAVVNNRAGGSWNLAGDYNFFNVGNVTPAFNNAGLFKKTAGAGTSVAIQVPFTNTGTVQANAGAINFSGLYTQNAGASVLAGGSIADVANLTLRIQGGSVLGSGALGGAMSNTGGALMPGVSTPTPLVGALSVGGNYQQGSSAVYNVKIGGTAAGQFDTTTVGGAATLGGTLTVSLINSFTPALGHSFTILSANSVSGVFSSANLPALASGLGWHVTYNAGSVVLSVISATVPAATLGTTTVLFPNTVVGQSSAVMTVTLQNTGSSALTITSIQPTGTDASNYSYSADPTSPCPISPNKLNGGASCTIDITFRPVSAGAHNSAQIIITDDSGGVGGSTQTISLSGAGIGLYFVPITPCRVLDTRLANGPFGGPAITGQTSRSFVIPNSACNIPANAQAYSMNVAVVPQGQLGFLTVWPTGQAQPYVATLNSDGRIKSNAAIIPAGTGGAISAFATNTTDLVLDINGYFLPSNNAPAGMQFYPITPCRLVDTRLANGALGGPFIGGQTTRTFPLTSGACGIPGVVQAYSVNFAAVPRVGTLGYLTAWPTGQAQPYVANLNAPTGTVTANAGIVPAGTNGSINVFATNDTDLVIDVNGYFAPPGAPGGLSLYNVTPCRVLDTRLPAGSPPFSGTINVNAAASGCGAPASAQALVFNATVVPSGGLGFLTLWPQGTAQPYVATLNASDGAITGNMAIVPDTNGSISAYATNATHLVLDLFGYFAP